jgi:hypothetical protein
VAASEAHRRIERHRVKEWPDGGVVT